MSYERRDLREFVSIFKVLSESGPWRKFYLDGFVRDADQPGDGPHRLPAVLQLEPLHHLRHHDVQLQAGKALADAGSARAEYLFYTSFIILKEVPPDPMAKRKVSKGVRIMSPDISPQPALRHKQVGFLKVCRVPRHAGAYTENY